MRAARLIEAASEAAREEVALYRREPERLPELELGSFEERPASEAARLRLALRTRIPPRALAIAPGRDGDRFVRAYAFWHAVRRALRDGDLFRSLTQGVTVLMYHAFGVANEPPSRFVLPAAAFERQLRWLRRRPMIDLAELASCRRDSRLPPANAVAITIDDVYADFLDVAPLLARHNAPATAFVVTGKAGRSNDWDREGELTGRPLLSWKDLAGLACHGVAIGAHTRNHPELTRLAPESARDEITASRADLEDRLGTPPETFSYPHGRVNDAVEALVAEAGFALACGIERGRNGARTPMHRLRRLEVDGRISLARFAVALAR